MVVAFQSGSSSHHKSRIPKLIIARSRCPRARVVVVVCGVCVCSLMGQGGLQQSLSCVVCDVKRGCLFAQERAAATAARLQQHMTQSLKSHKQTCNNDILTPLRHCWICCVTKLTRTRRMTCQCKLLVVPWRHVFKLTAQSFFVRSHVSIKCCACNMQQL